MADNKVNQDAFEEYKSGIEKQLESINATLLRIESSMATKENIETIKSEIKLSEKDTRNWVLGSALAIVIAFVVWLFMYLFPNIDKIIRALEAIR